MKNIYTKVVLSESFMEDIEKRIKKEDKLYRKRVKRILKKLNKNTDV